MNEKVIVSQAQEGRETAYRHLYMNYREMIYRLAYSYTGSQECAEDVMQETFIKAFKALSRFTYKKSNSLSSWLSRICINCSISHLRKLKRKQMEHMMSLTDTIIEQESDNPSPEASVQTDQTLGLIKDGMQKLSPKQRIIFNLRYMQHMNIKEIAASMNCSEGTVKIQLFRSMAKLRKHLSPLWEEL